MSTKGTLFLSPDMETHVYLDVSDNLVHINNGTGWVKMEPDLWRDIVASEADRALRAVQYVAKPSAPRPTCRKCGVIDVMHFTSGPCPGFEAQR